jgi:hypothetical protein
VLVALIGALGAAGIGSIVVAYIQQDTELALARAKQDAERESAERGANRAMRNDFLASL